MSGLNSSTDERIGVRSSWTPATRTSWPSASSVTVTSNSIFHSAFTTSTPVVSSRRHEVLVDERQDAELLHSASRCRPLCRKFMACTVSSTVNSRRAVSSGTARRSFRSRHRTMMSSSTWSIVYW